VRCADAGRVTPGQLVDHIVPIAEAPELRLEPGNLQTLCVDCHAIKTSEDQLRGGAAPTQAMHWPHYLKPSRWPLTIVCGAPASGKSAWVERERGPDDRVIDLDEIAGVRQRSDAELARALVARNRLLMELSQSVPTPQGACAWFVVGAPSAREREKWAGMLDPTRLVVLETPAHVCDARAAGDRVRAAAARRWWQRYERRAGEERIASVSV
jgi:5-methylcytosine-specific restriction protein A